MLIDFEEYLCERLGVNEDVHILSEFLYNKLKDENKNKVVIEKDFPENISFKIKKIIIEFKSDVDYNASFNKSRSKLTEDGYILYLIFNREGNLMDNLYHEFTHVIKFDKLTIKKIKGFNSNVDASDYFDKKKFKRLIGCIYMSDESEINAAVAEFYSKISKFFKSSNNTNKSVLFKSYIKNLDRYSDELINYNIFEDLENISDKDKLYFFRKFTKIRNIYKESDNKLLIAYKLIKMFILDKPDNRITLYYAMCSLQRFINKQGEKLKLKTHKLYDLI